MRQTHSIANSSHKPPQALAALKNTLRKYLKRERRKPLPEGVEFWDFDCRVGPSEDDAQPVHVKDVITEVDAIITGGSQEVYVEILAKPGVRVMRGPKPASKG